MPSLAGCLLPKWNLLLSDVEIGSFFREFVVTDVISQSVVQFADANVRSVGMGGICCCAKPTDTLPRIIQAAAIFLRKCVIVFVVGLVCFYYNKSLADRYLSASMAALQPLPAAVIA